MKSTLLRWKPVMFLVVAITITSCAVPLQPEESAVPLQPEESEEEGAAYWSCVDSLEYSLYRVDPSRGWPAPAVKAWVLSEPLVVSGDTYSGKIESGGIRKDAVYHQQGLVHRWDFDWNQEAGAYAAAFVIKPNGTGLYYYFGGEEAVEPSLRTKCKKVH